MALATKNRREEVALAIRVGVPHLGRVAQGIRDFADAETDWRFLISPETHDLPPRSLEGWRGSGVIAQCNTPEEVRILSALKCPVVNISGALRETPFPRVINDYREIGRRAAEFLRERGFRRFGFYGVADVWYSSEIEEGFCSAIQSQGLQVELLHSASTMEAVPRWDHGQEELEEWLLSQQPPFAVMAAHDPRATMVIRACEKVGLQVPSDVAAIGVNDDTITCETSRPTLTSIRRSGHLVGRLAAEALYRLMRGEAVEAETVIVPGRFMERESTRTLAIDHPALAAAVDFVRLHYHEAVGVEQIVAASGQSRRWLEEAFRRELSCSPAGFLKRERVKACQRAIRSKPAIGPGELAIRCGFSGTRQLNAVFERETGVSVKAFQETVRASR
ncbi:MAG: DNA-binding transcriptional regulator [Verrucomicrobiales bacterium]|nr:DNA-binding transcriptional regulator [Verrucomicrobiales bacterium]